MPVGAKKMIKILKKLLRVMLKKGTAVFVCTAFVFTSHPMPEVKAEISSGPTLSYRSLLDDMSMFTLSKDIGKIQETYRGATDKVVVLIQDAHSIPDAQRSIQSTIDHFQTEYGISLVGLEGASEKLDPQIFKSFPDKELLQKTFDAYAERGELTGGTAAALFNTSPVIYQGVEDWPLYEEGISYFLEATKRAPEMMKSLQPMFDSLEREKQGVYSKELLELDRMLTSFSENEIDLVQVLKQLSQYQEPEKDSELAVLLKEIERKPELDTAIEIEIKKIAEKFESILKGLPTPVTTSGELQEFNKNYQDFQTSRMTPQAFALYLKDGIKKHNIKVKVSRALVSLVENQRKLKDIEGTQLFKEFEHYADVVKESLFQNDEQKILDRKAQGLALIKRLNQLELSFEDWEKIQKMILQLDQWTVTQDGVVNRDEVSSLLKKMESHLAFYRVAEKRDAVFFKNIQAMMKRENKTTSLLVAGGFHTEGLTKTFKEKGISYVLVTPSIKAIPEEPLYLQHMQGQVSWSDYFEVKNGKVNLYDAFVRATRDKLLSHKEAFANYGKEWRDQIIRDLAATGRITQASEYTRFIDETLQTENQNKIKIERIRDAWLANIDRFDDGLKNLQMKGNLNEANIASLIKTITTAELATSNIFGVNTKSELRLLPWLQQSLAEKSPVDIRSEMRTTDVQSQDLTPMSDRVIPEGYRNIALVMESRGQGFGIPGAMITLVRNLQASYGENVNIRVLVPERMKTAGWLGAAANDFENFRSRLPAGVELETYRDLSQNAQADVAVYYGYSDMGTSYLKNATLPGVKVAYHIPMYIYGYDKEFGRYKNVIDAQGTVHHVVPTANASGSNSNLFLDDFLTRERLKIESLPEGEVRKQRAEILDALKLPNNTTVLESAWAYAYTQSSEALEDYIQNLRKYAARTGQKVTLFLVRGSEINKKTFRSKADYSEVKIVQLEPSLDKKDSYNKILLLTGSLTKDGNDTSRLMADVPNLVTGSQSFSEALASLTLLSHDAFNVNPEEGRGLVAALFKKGFPEFIEKYNPGFKDPDWSVLFTGEVDGSPIEDWSSAQMIADFRAELLPFLKQNNVVNTITDGILQNARGDIHDTVTLEQIQQAESPKVLAVMEFLDDLFYRKLPEFYAGSPKKGEYFLFNEGSVEDIWVEDVIPRGYESAKGTAVVNLRKQGIASFESIRKAWGYEGDQEMTPAIEGKPREDYGEVIDIALKFLRLLLRDSTGATQVNYVGLPIGQHISDKAGGTRQGGQLDRHELRSEGVEKISAARAELANFLNTSDLVQALNKVFSDTEWAVKNSEGKTGSLKFKRVPLENSDDVAFEIQHIGNTSTNETPREFYFRVDPNHQQQIVLEFAYTYAPLELVAKISQILRAIAPQKDTAPSVILKGVVYNLTTLLQLAESVPESEQGDAKDLIQSLRGRIEKDEDIDVRLDKEIFNFKFDSDRRELTEVVVNYLQRGGKISPQDILRTRLGNLAGIFSTDVALKVEDDQLYIQSTFSEAAEKTSAFQLTDESEALQFVDPEIENMINRGFETYR
jgi:hypothetical protein